MNPSDPTEPAGINVLRYKAAPGSRIEPFPSMSPNTTGQLATQLCRLKERTEDEEKLYGILLKKLMCSEGMMFIEYVDIDTPVPEGATA